MNDSVDRFEEAPDVPEKMNIFMRLWNLLVSPGKLFAYLRNKPTLLFPIIVMCVGAVLVHLILWDHTKDLQMDVLYNTYKAMGMSSTPEQLQTMVNAQMIATLIFAPVGMLVTWLITTLIMYLVYRLAGCEKGLKKYFSMIGYISILSILAQLIHSVFLAYAGGDMMSASVTSLASLLDKDSVSHFLYGIASGIEIFNIWSFILYAIGFVYTGRVEKRKSYMTTAILFVIVLLFSAGFSVLSVQLLSNSSFGSFMGQ